MQLSRVLLFGLGIRFNRFGLGFTFDTRSSTHAILSLAAAAAALPSSAHRGKDQPVFSLSIINKWL